MLLNMHLDVYIDHRLIIIIAFHTHWRFLFPSINQPVTAIPTLPDNTTPDFTSLQLQQQQLWTNNNLNQPNNNLLY